MTRYFGVDWLAMCFTFSAIYLLGNKSRKGFVLMMLGNLCWSAICIWAHSYAMVLTNIGFFRHEFAGLHKVVSPGGSVVKLSSQPITD